MKRKIYFLLTVIFISCQGPSGRNTLDLPREGMWRGIIKVQDQELPFNFELDWKADEPVLILMNGKEKIKVDDIRIERDSIYIPMHIFDATIISSIGKNSLKGYWKKNYLEDYKLPFQASFDKDYRFSENPEVFDGDISGKWEVYFLEDNDSSLAIGIFEQSGSRLTGTFLKPTGDYRYLEGEMDGNQLKLSTFDGEHAYLFKAVLKNDSILHGDFWSGKSWHQLWTATRNEKITLPDPMHLTWLQEGYETINFSLPDMNGEIVTLSDEKFRDKVVIVQIFGTWCPNCMDETKFLTDWYSRNKDRGVEIVALAFERKDDFDYARERIRRMKKKFNTGYEFLFAGIANKDHASNVLPMLNRVVSFPTLIFIGRDGMVRHIHTGFSGPGTGKYYEKFVEDFNTKMNELLSEK